MRNAIVIVKCSHYTLASILLVVAVACGEGSVDPEVECLDSAVSVTATVDVSGTDPVFDWVPDCAVALVFVEGVTEGDVWGVQSLANLIPPPITYGTTSIPAASGTIDGPLPLVRGRSYFFILGLLVDPVTTTCTDLVTDQSQTFCRLVIHEFTW